MPQIKSVNKIGRYITVESAAARSGWSKSFIHYLVRTHDVMAVRFGGCIGVDMISLDDYMATRGRTAEHRSGEE